MAPESTVEVKPYAIYLQQQWTIVIEQSINLRRLLMAGNETDEEILRDFCARLCRLWLELKSQVKAKDNLGDAAKNFNTFQEIAENPTWLTEDKPANGIETEKIITLFKLEQSLMDVLTGLDILRL